MGPFWDVALLSVAGGPLLPPPDLLPKTAYESVRPVLYLSLWDALQYMEEVSAAVRGAGPGSPRNSWHGRRKNQFLITLRSTLQL